MKILTFSKEKTDPEFISEKTKIMGKLIVYLFETKDESLIEDSEIERIEIYDKTCFECKDLVNININYLIN